MTLKVDWHDSLDSVGRAAWQGLESVAPRSSVFQSWWWLNAWWPVWGEGTPVVLVARDAGVIQGAGAFFLGNDGTLRLIGEEHADYGGLLAMDDSQAVAEAMIEALFAPPIRWRRLLFHDVPLTSPLATALRRRGAIEGSHVPCPRVAFAERPLATLLAKDSLRRHERKLREQGTVEFRHVDSAAEILPLLPRFVAQHVERWSLTPHPSLFGNPRNVEFYSRLSETAEPGGSLLFSTVELDGHPVAMHFGLRSANDLIWYKPTFDPRLAHVGPGEVLLAELLRRAGREEAAGLDFTRGDEAFKLRFASETRYVASLEAWSSAGARRRALALRGLRQSTVAFLTRVGVRERVSDGMGLAQRAVSRAREEGAAALVTRARQKLSEPRAATLEVFAVTGAPDLGPDTKLAEVLAMTSIGELLEHVDPADSEHAHLLREAKSRFLSGDTLYAGIVNDELVVHGWQTVNSPIPVLEIDAELGFAAGTRLLYDFWVRQAARGRGYFGALLRAIVCDRGAAVTVIYCRTDHVVSRRAIQSAGFGHIGTFSASEGGPRFEIKTTRPIPELVLKAGRGT